MFQKAAPELKRFRMSTLCCTKPQSKIKGSSRIIPTESMLSQFSCPSALLRWRRYLPTIFKSSHRCVICDCTRRNSFAIVTNVQGSFGCALRISCNHRAFVIKVLDITQNSYRWVMREILFGYHLAKFHHPNIAQLLYNYSSPNSDPPHNEFSAGCCVYFVQDDCGQSLIQ